VAGIKGKAVKKGQEIILFEVYLSHLTGSLDKEKLIAALGEEITNIERRTLNIEF
jgi:hypothetical protein